ncbi:hypothetical protein [Streptomyces sp. NPDC002851]
MAALAWLLIPLMAAIGAGMWGSWATRSRRAEDISELAGYAKFRAAMERSEQSSGQSPMTSLMGPESGTDTT